MPLAVDLFAGLGGWTEGLLAEGYRVVGFDIERHVYGEARYPAQLVLQNVLTLHGKQLRNAALIVASPSCQEFSYMAMPWSRAKTIEAEYRSGVRDVKKLTALFDACFRIQREAMQAVRHHCKTCGVFMLSHHEWTKKGACSQFVQDDRYIPLVVENVCGAQKWVGKARWHFGSFYLWGDVPALMPITRRGTIGKGQNPDGRKTTGVKHRRDGHAHTKHLTNQTESQGVKQGGDWFNAEQPSISRRCGSKSTARKAASAHIAKIPYELARHIARAWYPA